MDNKTIEATLVEAAAATLCPVALVLPTPTLADAGFSRLSSLHL